MEEVDYSRFIYRPERPEPPEKNGRGDKHKKTLPSKKPTVKRVVTVIVAVILCFAILFLCVDFFAKGKVLDYIYSLIGKTKYSYYCVARSYPTRDMAHAGAIAAEKGGGAAYLFTENGDFYVIFGIYADNNAAKTVSAKNSGSFIYTLSYSTSSTELASLLDSLVREVCLCLDKIDGGTFTESSLATIKNTYSIKLAAYESKNEKETSLVSFASSCLSEISPGTTERTSLLFQTRHMVCSILFSARDAFI